MAYWIFKIAEQKLYPDIHGDRYVYDNTHSIKVQPKDIFLYLDKTQSYSVTATGTVKKITERSPTDAESKRTNKVRVVYTAHLSDIIWFQKPLLMSTTHKEGVRNRAQLGIVDVNLLGWSQSIASITEPMYNSILKLADIYNLVPPATIQEHLIPDQWSNTKTRPAIKYFSDSVLARSKSCCIVCSVDIPGIVDAAHIIPYSIDCNNRANPANGICLCKFCHAAFDLRLIAITPDGDLIIHPGINNRIALSHFSAVTRDQRKIWLEGVNPDFLNKAVEWHHDYCRTNVSAERRTVGSDPPM